MQTMNTTRNPSPKTDLAVTHVLAQLLEKLEHSPVHEFEDVEQGAELGRLLDAYPAAAEVYENINYQHAGLCRSALDASLSAEVSAREAIARAMRGAQPNNKDMTHGEG